MNRLRDRFVPVPGDQYCTVSYIYIHTYILPRLFPVLCLLNIRNTYYDNISVAFSVLL